MKRTYLIFLILLTLFCLPGAPRSSVQAQDNLLQNPGFESPYSNGEAGGWTSWHRVSSEDLFDDCANGYHKRPQWGQATDFVYEGSSSQFIGNNWDTWAGGMQQNVSVTPGATYRFSFWARGRGSMDPAPDPSNVTLQMNLRAGIDPNGSGSWSDGDVVWSAAGNAHDQWVQFSVEATATGDTITVFTAADWGVQGVNQCYQFLSTYYDAASLVAAAPPPTNTPPPPPPPPPATNTPLPTPTSEFTATPSPVPTATSTSTPEPPQGGRICVNAFDDLNANGVHDESEGYIAGVTFTVANTEVLIGTAVSSGRDEPFCFENVPPGTYRVEQQVPGRLQMTTAGSASITVEEGQPIGLEFGSRLVTADLEPTDTSSPDTLASNNQLPAATVETAAGTGEQGGGLSSGVVTGFIFIAAAVVLLGALLYFILRRQTQ